MLLLCERKVRVKNEEGGIGTALKAERERTVAAAKTQTNPNPQSCFRFKCQRIYAFVYNVSIFYYLVDSNTAL